MVWVGFSFAVVSMATMGLSHPGMFLAAGFGLAATALGFAAYRLPDSGPRRLLAAFTTTLGIVGATIAGARIVATYFAVRHLENLFT